jgi:hypothetical protein
VEFLDSSLEISDAVRLDGIERDTLNVSTLRWRGCHQHYGNCHCQDAMADNSPQIQFQGLPPRNKPGRCIPTLEGPVFQPNVIAMENVGEKGGSTSTFFE